MASVVGAVTLPLLGFTSSAVGLVAGLYSAARLYSSAGLAIGAFDDHSSSRQQAYVRKMKCKEHAIHIYPEKIYIGMKKLPGTPDMRNLILKDNATSRSEKSVIILAGRQFTINDTGRVSARFKIG